MISVLIPTRKRLEGLLRTIDSIKVTQASRTDVVCYVDEDDHSYDELKYERSNLFLTTREGLFGLTFVVGPRIVLSNTWNKCAKSSVGDILGQGNDDIIFRTPGWDAMVENAFQEFPDKILLAHGSDGSNGPSGSQGLFGPHPFIHRRWVQTVGYFTPAYFSSDFGDTWLGHLANAIGRRRFLPFVIEHMHHWLGKADIDETTRERLDRHSNDSVERLYRNLAPLREIDIDKLKAAMK